MNFTSRLPPGRRCIARHLLNFGLALLCLPVFALLAANSSAQTPAGSAASESRASGAITGRVIGEDGTPLSQVRIVAFRTGVSTNSSANATSDGEGKFTLNNLPFGSYFFNAFAPGYTLEFDQTSDPATRSYYRIGDSVTLRMIKGGVITGTVTGADGDPVVGLPVVPLRVRGADGHTVREPGSGRPRPTDDRGIYRIYGLRPGSYLVRAGGRSPFGQPTAYDADTPTYHPSATRDTASEVTVQAGQETTGIDIRYRGELGRVVSGAVSGALPSDLFISGTVSVSLKHVSASAPEAFAYLQPGTLNHNFSFDAVADGEYDIAARTISAREDVLAVALPRRINVRGADITGISLTLVPLASVSGQVNFELAKSPETGKPACQSAPVLRPEELIVFTRRVDPNPAVAQVLPPFPATNESAPDGKGYFRVRNLQAGRYQLLVRLPAEDFYLRALTFAHATARTTTATPAAPPGNKPVPTPPARTASALTVAAQSGFTLRAGERLTGLTVHIAPGASSLRGRIVAPTDEITAATAAPLNAQLLRAHLVPAEHEHFEDVLRYAETSIGADGTFAFVNLAPGRYRLIARPAAPVDKQADNLSRPLAWDADARARLRREAESANVALTLAPCQHIGHYLLPHPAK